MKPMKPAIVLLIVVVVGLLSGLGGWQIAKMQRPVGRGNFEQGVGGVRGGTAGGAQNFRGGQGTGRVAGQILSTDERSLTVKLMDGSSKIIILSDQTMINKAAQGSKEDLTTGTTVAVFGMTNPDGSVTAQSVQLNPMTPPGENPKAK